MAVTNENLSGDRPTSWSAAMDQAAASVMPGEADQPNAPKRLVVISAGNIPDDAKAADPALFPIEDPAQTWNPLTVGGFTDRDSILHPLYRNWTPAAEVGDRSPYSRTSRDWPDTMPIKPDVVFEAGNRALSPNGLDLVAGIESLSVLTTNKEFRVRPLVPVLGHERGSRRGRPAGGDDHGGAPRLLAGDRARADGAPPVGRQLCATASRMQRDGRRSISR
jgi:hypothetical protein